MEKTKKYTPAKGTEAAVHVMLHKEGYDSQTGKAVAPPQFQYLNTTEWTNLVLRPIGYVVDKVLYLPKGCLTQEEIIAKNKNLKSKK